MNRINDIKRRWDQSHADEITRTQSYKDVSYLLKIIDSQSKLLSRALFIAAVDVDNKHWPSFIDKAEYLKSRIDNLKEEIEQVTKGFDLNG